MGEIIGGTRWSELPEHLIEGAILARLPWDSVSRLRAVCRGWNDLLSSKYFLRGWADASGERHPLLMLCMPKSHMRCLLYSFASNSWQTLSLLFIEENCGINYSGSAAGLILMDIPTYSYFGHSFPHLSVCNPLSRKRLRLPEMEPALTTVMARGIVSAAADGYKVVVLGRSSLNSALVQVYDSAAKSWKVIAADLPQRFAVRNEELVFCRGLLLCMTIQPLGVLVWDVDGDGSCRVLAMPVAQGSNLWPRLLACGSSVLLVGAIEKDNILVDMIVWEFCDPHWKEIARMPRALCEDFQRSAYSNWFECVGVGDNMCFRAYGSIEVLTYSLSRGYWTWLPQCTATHGNPKHLLLKSLPYEPRPHKEV